IMVGLMFAMFPAALDETIIATSMSTIASTFDALALAPWIATAYWMTITAFSPIFGKLSDVFGLRSCLLYSVALFLATSVLCAVSFNMVWLIVFRAISGIAAAGLLTVTLIAISKITTPAERSKFLGYFNLNYCLTCVVGPLLGGVLTERLNWRWCFYINIPLCVAAFIIIYLTLKENPAGVHSAPPSWLERARKLDYTGTLLILAGVILLVLAIEWGGDATHYGWKSPIVLGLLCGGILLLALFVLVELRWAADPVVNLPILKVRNVAISSITNFVMGWVLYAVIYFVPLYFQ
ncbi:major facilitator superfamily domain-containing protein, partial [Dimargaris cristalligena]